MPAKIDCPFAADELKRMYEDEGLSLKGIGNAAGVLLGVNPVSTPTVFKWLSDVGIRTRKSGENKYVACPFSAETLDWHYWGCMKTTRQIAALVGEILNRPPVSHRTVSRWLRDADIHVRTTRESRRIEMKKDPERFRTQGKNTQKKLRELRNAGLLPLPTPGPRTFDKDKRLGRKARSVAQQNWAARRITRQCDNPGCSQLITRAPSKFKCRYAFCSDCMKNGYRRPHTVVSVSSVSVELPVIADWIAEVREDFRAKHGTI